MKIKNVLASALVGVAGFAVLQAPVSAQHTFQSCYTVVCKPAKPSTVAGIRTGFGGTAAQQTQNNGAAPVAGNSAVVRGAANTGSNNAPSALPTTGGAAVLPSNSNGLTVLFLGLLMFLLGGGARLARRAAE